MSTSALPSGTTTLRGRWLLLARAAWIAVAITALAIVLFSVPSSFEHYRTVCTAASEVCSERAVGQPTPEGVRSLRDVGLSVGSYSLLNVVIDKVFQLVWFAVGALIFWRRSDDRIALLVSAFLVAFGTVTVDTTDADALVSSQPAWWLPVQGVQIMGEVCVVLFFLLFPQRTLRAALDSLARRRVHRFHGLQRPLSGAVLWFARRGDGFTVGVHRVSGEPALVSRLSLPESLLC
jgi:hypothetical protein